MNLVKNKRGLAGWIAVLLLCSTIQVQGNEKLEFAPSWDQQWQTTATDGGCALTLGIAEYGEARFVATATTSPGFELQARQDFHQAGPINVAKFAPQWHPADPWREEMGTISHIEGGGAVAGGALAANMLLALRQGLHIELSASAWFDKHTDIALYLTARALRPALATFLACAHTQVKVSWQDMSRTRISYQVDDHQLDEVAKTQLRGLVRYVQQDPAITKLIIDGHTDASGSNKANVLLAKRRAEVVAAYLHECGLISRQLQVRYHGAAYPVGDNSTAAGKASNRRTTVRLERSEPDKLAQK